jgi:hypothetical protein
MCMVDDADLDDCTISRVEERHARVEQVDA